MNNFVCLNKRTTTLVAVSKGMEAVRLCSIKIVQFTGWLYYGHKWLLLFYTVS